MQFSGVDDLVISLVAHNLFRRVTTYVFKLHQPYIAINSGKEIAT